MTAQIGTTQTGRARLRAASFGGLLDASQGSTLRTLVFLFFVWVLLKNAWLSEDSFITFRVSDNLIHGLGLRWNPLERVQVYTNPLWMLWVSAVYFVSRDIYFAAMASSLLCSGLAVWLLLSRALRSAEACLIAGVAMTFSKAFMDYSTSGLENRSRTCSSCSSSSNT